MAETASGSPGSQDEASPADQAQRKFRDALDRKRAKEAEAGGARQGKNAGKIHGAHGPAHSRRSFRRKSG
ncbi:MAG TPA: DUF5302 domain-containing protein [Streptosporangiaceae bacterium]|jgi:hypothetical protein|nr:DUF5302 domain-containing protein [Streptosporangiaceae bacterium]